MTQQHPITPPPELVDEWAHLFSSNHSDAEIFSVITQWGADQELEACCDWLGREGWSGESRQLRAARRPKPPSLKEQALDAHNRMMAGEETQDDWAIVRRALEQLDD